MSYSFPLKCPGNRSFFTCRRWHVILIRCANWFKFARLRIDDASGENLTLVTTGLHSASANMTISNCLPNRSSPKATATFTANTLNVRRSRQLDSPHDHSVRSGAAEQATLDRGVTTHPQDRVRRRCWRRVIRGIYSLAVWTLVRHEYRRRINSSEPIR